MKYLLLLRHGKAETYSFDKEDFERNLSTRGVNNCEQIAQVVKRNNILPEYIIASPANRTLQTAQIFAEELHYDSSKIVSYDFLYDHLGVSDFLELLKTIPDEVKTAMIVGHNPWITSLSSSMSKGFFHEIPTTGIICLAFDTKHWSKIEAQSGKLEFFEHPKK